MALILLAGTAACTASPRYPINASDRPGDGGLVPWQPRYPVSAQDAAQNASDRASGSAIPPRTGAAYPTPPAPAYAAPVAPPPPPPSDDDAPRPMSSAPVDSSELPPPSAAPPPPPRSGPYIQSELEAESPLLPSGVVLASYDESGSASSGLMPGVELAALHHRRHHAPKAETDDAQKDEPASGRRSKGKHGRAADADSGEHITLKPGESLDAAAKRLHISREELLAANGIKDPRRVRAGTVLTAAAPSHAGKSARAEHAGSDEAANADAGEHITLKPGESLDAAAKRLHTSRDELMAANGIKNPRRVRAGTILKAPAQAGDGARADETVHAGETARAGHAERAERTAHAAQSDTSYDVRKGDTLYSIGRRFGKDPEALAKLNGLRSAAGLRAGQTLKLAASEEAPEREGRRHGAAAEAPAREIDLPPPDRFTQEAMRKESRGAHLTRRERHALAREDAREQAAAVASAAPKHRRGGHGSDAAAEVAADAAASQALAQSQVSPSRSHRRAVAEAEGPATYNPPPPIYHPAPAPAVASASRAANGDTDIPPPVTVAPSTPSPAPTTATPPPTASGSVATLNAPTYRPNYSPSLGRARPVAPEATVGGAVSASDIATAGKGRFIWPLKGSILAPFGDRGPGQHNDGLDIAAQSGDSVRAAAAGEVVYAGSSIPGFGNLVLVKHAGGWVTAYAHLNRIEVRMRDTVAQGDEIGQAGQTGAVDRPMLHFEVRYAPQATEKARPVDPTLVLPGG